MWNCPEWPKVLRVHASQNVQGKGQGDGPEARGQAGMLALDLFSRSLLHCPSKRNISGTARVSHEAERRTAATAGSSPKACCAKGWLGACFILSWAWLRRSTAHEHSCKKAHFGLYTVTYCSMTVQHQHFIYGSLYTGYMRVGKLRLLIGCMGYHHLWFHIFFSIEVPSILEEHKEWDWDLRQPERVNLLPLALRGIFSQGSLLWLEWGSSKLAGRTWLLICQGDTDFLVSTYWQIAKRR